MTELCELAVKYGSDKVPVGIGHNYTPAYHELFKNMRGIKKILEIGIGFPAWMPHVPNYKTGASLFMWRDYFPEAQIYAADIMSFALVNEDRIRSFQCDQSKEEDLRKLAQQIGDEFDLIIDDGSHVTDHQLLTFKMLNPLLSKDGLYIIEDVSDKHRIEVEMHNYDFDCEIRDFGKQFVNDCFVILRRK